MILISRFEAQVIALMGPRKRHTDERVESSTCGRLRDFKSSGDCCTCARVRAYYVIRISRFEAQVLAVMGPRIRHI